MSGVKKEKPRLKYAVELSRHIQGFGLYLTLAILCNLMFKLLPLATSLVTSYMVSSVLLGEARPGGAAAGSLRRAGHPAVAVFLP